MGEARIRRLKGTLHIPKEVIQPVAARMIEAERNWYPMAKDLALPSVPFDSRQDVRWALCFLGKVPIQPRDGSWLIAQAITELANSPRVEYVEGLTSTVGGRKVTPGAWNLVDGHVVSLFTEAKDRLKENAETWMYEPLKTYSLAEIYEAKRVGHPTCSAHEWLATVRPGTKPDYAVIEKVFRTPLNRMLERKNAMDGVIDFNWE